jgi:HSP20 family protein
MNASRTCIIWILWRLRMAERSRQDSRQDNSTAQQQGLSRQENRRGELARSSSSAGWALGSPFDLMRRFSEEMQGFFGHAGTWEPAIEVSQRGNELVIRADLPGLNADDVIVDIADDAVTIRGERREEHEEEHDGFFRSERVYGTFYRVIPLPEGAIAETARATFNNGVLEIVVQAPPRDVSRGRRLEIEDRQSNQQQAGAQQPGAQQGSAQTRQPGSDQSQQQGSGQTQRG